MDKLGKITCNFDSPPMTYLNNPDWLLPKKESAIEKESYYPY